MSAIIVLGQIGGGTSATAGVLARLGLPYASTPLPDHFEDLDLRGEMDPYQRAVALRDRENKWGPDTWLYKDPHALHDWQWWAPSTADFARFVIVMRDPAAIASEWADHHKALLTACQRMNSLILAAQTLKPCMVVSYEKLIVDPRGWSAKLADFAGVDDVPGAEEFVIPGGYRELEIASG